MNTLKKRKNRFTQISNDFLRDDRISFKSKGLFCYMFSMEDNWNFTIKSIAKQQKDGEASVKSALDELKEFNYIVYEKHQDGSGTYYLNDTPNVENPNVENPKMGKSPRIKNNNSYKNNNNKYIPFFLSVEQIESVIKYRRSIKKPFKTDRGIKTLENEFKACMTKGYAFNELFELMQNKEWQSIKLEWVERELKPKQSSKMQGLYYMGNQAL